MEKSSGDGESTQSRGLSRRSGWSLRSRGGVVRWVFDLVNDFRDVSARVSGRLQERDQEQPSDDVPLVVLDPTEKRTDLVLEGFATEPENGQFQRDADADQGNESTSGNPLMAGHDADQVTPRHEEEEQPTRFGNRLLEPFVDRWQIAHLPFRPADGSLAVPASQVEQHDGGEKDAQEADDCIGKWIDERYRAEQVPVSRREHQDGKRMLVDKGWADVRSDRARGEESCRGDENRAASARTDVTDG